MPNAERYLAPESRRWPSELCVGAVAPDHAELRRIAAALAGPEFVVAAVSFELPELLRETADLELDAVVCHCGGSLTGLPEMAARVRQRLPEVTLVAICRSVATHDLRRALGAGLDAVVLDSELETALAAAVRAACAGQLSIPRDARPQVYGPALSYGEREVIACVGAGLTNSQIAAQLHISPSTVKNRLATAFDKLGVRSRGEAAEAMMSVKGKRDPNR
jgi:DNA-binding NarL/FixJ family response regulator